ncbi:MAG: outer membrane protein assembly factor BamB family protein [Alphaproteobacteria bacterium]
MTGRIRPAGIAVVGLLALTPLSGCSDTLDSLPKLGDLNPFAETQVPLPGRRISVMPAQGNKLPGDLADASKPIALPPQRVNEDWAQPGGDPNNAPGHLAFNGTVKEVWSADAGEGSSSSGRVTASPIVYGGNIYTLDAEGNLSAFATSGGSAKWRISLKPDRENAQTSIWTMSLIGGGDGGGYGGGLAADSGRLYAATGYGNVVAMDPQTGKKIWEKMLGAPVRASPTAAGDRVFVVTLDGRFYCLAGADGGELWSVRGLPQQASLLTNASPAVEGEIVVVPYPSGELVALKVADGTAVWSESLTRTRTTSQVSSMSDTARPAIFQGTVYAVGHAGRMVATQSATGERLWSLNVPGTQAPWVAGDSVFVVDTAGQLMAISRTAGKVQWTVQLPGGGSWSGPTLAGGTLWLASAGGKLVGVEAITGRVVVEKDLGDPVYIAPVVAQGRMYVLTDEAKLIALN